MKLNRPKRISVAHEIRRQLPWAHIIVGAIGYNFLEVSRGESIEGSYTAPKGTIGYGGSAWTRPLPGSYALHIDLGADFAELRRHMEPRRGETERMIVCKTWDVIESRDVKALADWIVSLAVQRLPEANTDGVQLSKHERIEVAVNELPELPVRVRR